MGTAKGESDKGVHRADVERLRRMVIVVVLAAGFAGVGWWLIQ